MGTGQGTKEQSFGVGRIHSWLEGKGWGRSRGSAREGGQNLPGTQVQAALPCMGACLGPLCWSRLLCPLYFLRQKALASTVVLTLHALVSSYSMEPLCRKPPRSSVNQKGESSVPASFSLCPQCPAYPQDAPTLSILWDSVPSIWSFPKPHQALSDLLHCTYSEPGLGALPCVGPMGSGGLGLRMGHSWGKACLHTPKSPRPPQA